MLRDLTIYGIGWLITGTILAILDARGEIEVFATGTDAFPWPFVPFFWPVALPIFMGVLYFHTVHKLAKPRPKVRGEYLEEGKKEVERLLGPGS